VVRFSLEHDATRGVSQSFYTCMNLYKTAVKTQQTRHFAEDSNAQVKPQAPSYTAGFAV
jgi:hypothetical protein